VKRAVAALVGVALWLLDARTAVAAADDARRGLALAAVGRCDDAIPLLSRAEAQRSRPTTGEALARCLERKKQLVAALEMYEWVAAQERERDWTMGDTVARDRARRKKVELEKRVPTLSFHPAESYAKLTIELDGEPVDDPAAPQRLDPGLEVTVSAQAERCQPFRETVSLVESERYELRIELRCKKAATVPKPDGGDEEEPEPEPDVWIGTRFRGIVIPQFLMSAFGDGGTTVFVPGGALTVTKTTGGPDLIFSFGWAGYFVRGMPWKGKDDPDTEWELVDSNLQSFVAALDLMWSFPIDDAGRWRFRIGGGIGLGIAFFGDLSRNQAFPPDGKPGDPYQYERCEGPNDPPGTFRYCNLLDKDADHYPGHAEKTWFQGGSRPVIYPWISIPQLEIELRPSERVALDLELASTISGFMFGLGVRGAP
jgi:hypothetical protein